MTGPAALAPVAFDGSVAVISRLGDIGAGQAIEAPKADFQSILGSGLEAVNDRLAAADGLARQFAVDDSIPVHQVTLALEEARLSVELAMQIRARLVETYREFMNMQI